MTTKRSVQLSGTEHEMVIVARQVCSHFSMPYTDLRRGKRSIHVVARRVFCYLARQRGHTYASIAHVIGLSRHTVESYVQEIGRQPGGMVASIIATVQPTQLTN